MRRCATSANIFLYRALFVKNLRYAIDALRFSSSKNTSPDTLPATTLLQKNSLTSSASSALCGMYKVQAACAVSAH